MNKTSCNCRKLSCKKDCQRKHTCKRFFCYICEPQARDTLVVEAEDIKSIKNQFNIGDKVWVMHHNKVVETKIIDLLFVLEGKALSNKPEELFATKEELIKSLG